MRTRWFSSLICPVTVRDAKVAIYTCDFEMGQAETKGTVLLTSAQELLDYNKGEERNLEQKVKDIVDKGVNVVVSTKFGEVAAHFLDKYNVMMVKVGLGIVLGRDFRRGD